MQWFYRGLLVSCILLFFLSCRDESYKTEQTQAELRAVWNEFIDHWENEDAEACSKIFAKECVYLPPKYEELNGRSAIASLYLRLFRENLSSRYEHEILSIERTDDLAIERGYFTVYWIANDSTAWSYEARSLTHWIRQRKGNWKIKQIMFNNPPDPQ